jgi:hypothetical protein
MYFCYNLKNLKEREVDGGKGGVSEEFVTPKSTFGDCIGIKEEYGPNRC